MVIFLAKSVELERAQKKLRNYPDGALIKVGKNGTLQFKIARALKFNNPEMKDLSLKEQCDVYNLGCIAMKHAWINKSN